MIELAIGIFIGVIIGSIIGAIAIVDSTKEKLKAGMTPYISAANTLEWKQ
jgi:hypothetical protein